MKTDYSEEIKNLLSNNYEVVKSVSDESEYTLKKTLTELHKEITNILPSLWIQESDVYEALSELGFQSFLYTYDAELDKEGEELVPEKKEMLYLLDTKTAAI